MLDIEDMGNVRVVAQMQTRICSHYLEKSNIAQADIYLTEMRSLIQKCRHKVIVEPLVCCEANMLISYLEYAIKIQKKYSYTTMKFVDYIWSLIMKL